MVRFTTLREQTKDLLCNGRRRWSQGAQPTKVLNDLVQGRPQVILAMNHARHEPGQLRKVGAVRHQLPGQVSETKNVQMKGGCSRPDVAIEAFGVRCQEREGHSGGREFREDEVVSGGDHEKDQS